MIPGLVSRVLLSNNKNAPHLMAESGAGVPGFQIVKVVLMTIASGHRNQGVTLTMPNRQYRRQPAIAGLEMISSGAGFTGRVQE